MSFVTDFLEFLRAAPTSYQTVAEVGRRLGSLGFRQQLPQSPWDGSVGGHYLISGGAIVIWRIPRRLADHPGFRVVGVHTDSPTLKLKPQPDGESCGYQQAHFEIYGGLLLNSVLDRDLGLAGRLVAKTGKQYLVHTGPWLRVPQLAIHLDRSVNDGLTLDRQRHLVPILGQEYGDVIAALADSAKVSSADIASFDVFAYPTEPGQVIGLGQEFLAAARLDNLASLYPALQALLSADESFDIQVLVAFDHEEIGSDTATGAGGPLLAETLYRIAISLAKTGDDWYRMLAVSTCISADVAHGVHPNYPDRHDPQHSPTLNAGPVLKVNASGRYATEAIGTAEWVRACEQVEIPKQVFVSNNVMPCGSTIGPITATRLGIRTIDVGIPVLSMHSMREMCGVKDLPWLSSALAAFYSGVSDSSGVSGV